jgi:uncharacterized membrane protein
MNSFALALSAFVLLHVGLAATGLRAALVGRIGEGPYRVVFSLASAAALAWLIVSFGAMRADPFDPLNETLWLGPDWLVWPGNFFVVLGLTLAVTGILTRPGPTTAGFEKSGLALAKPARGVLPITRHPFLWGLAFWALGHLLLTGERFALMLFGALGLMVVFGARSIDRKGRARDPEAWARFEEATSNVPFAAIAQGRNRLALGEIGWRLPVALLIVAIIAWAHEPLIGAPAFSTSP